MKAQRLGRSFVGTIVGLFLASTALAAPPVIVREVNDFDFPILECDGFQVWTAGKERDSVKTWFDSAGEAVRVKYSIAVTESEYYNNTCPSTSVSQGKKGVGENLMTDVDLTSGDFHYAGGSFRLTIPGIGRVLWETGTCFFDASEGTFECYGRPFVLLEGETGPALCEALACPP